MMLPRVRAFVDYTSYVYAFHWPLLVGLLGVALGVVTLVPSTVGVVLSVVALLLSIVMLARDGYLARRAWTRLSFVRLETAFPVASVPPPPGYGEVNYVSLPGGRTMLVSDAIDRYLRSGPVAAQVQPDSYRLPEHLRAVAPIMLRSMRRESITGRRRDRRIIYNGPVIALHDDPLPVVGGHASPLRLVRATYFDAICSDELCGFATVDSVNGTILEPRLREIVDSNGALSLIAATELVNYVGLSTIALTSDGMLVTIQQGVNNVGSPGRLAPTGSGTLDPADLDSGDDQVLQTVLLRGMEREMREEAGIGPEQVADTVVTGYGRYLERGAKPEFFGLSRLTATADQVRGLRSEDPVFAKGVDFWPLDLAALAAELAAGTPVSQAAALPVDLLKTTSLPLLAALRAAAMATGVRPTVHAPRTPSADAPIA